MTKIVKSKKPCEYGREYLVTAPSAELLDIWGIFFPPSYLHQRGRERTQKHKRRSE